MDKKTCKKCWIEKQLDLFSNDKRHKTWKGTRCKSCIAISAKIAADKKRIPRYWG